ncbi:MAG: hypothetical protein EON56_00280 [Alphaproteobacteria bacterium]|nr:MAG: hypothetical protein EON56_00280 [Alphaproteobacteria bacterium]
MAAPPHIRPRHLRQVTSSLHEVHVGTGHRGEEDVFAAIKKMHRLSQTRIVVEDALRRASIFSGGALDPDKAATALTFEMQSLWSNCYSGKLPGGLPIPLSGGLAALALGLSPSSGLSSAAQAQVFMAVRGLQDTISANQHSLPLGPVDALLMNAADKLFFAYLEQAGDTEAVQAA